MSFWTGRYFNDTGVRTWFGTLIVVIFICVTGSVHVNTVYPVYLYFQHDISMITFLEAVGVKFTGWVPYFGSCLILELHEIGAGQFFTELWIFNNTEDGLADYATRIPIPGMSIVTIVSFIVHQFQRSWKWWWWWWWWCVCVCVFVCGGGSGLTGFTLFVHLSVCRWKRVCSVSSTILTGSISFLHILSTHFRRCATCWDCLKISQFEFLAKSFTSGC